MVFVVLVGTGCGASVSVGGPDASVTPDVPLATDVPVRPDVPVATDVPVARDVPVVSSDAPATCDWGTASTVRIALSGPGTTTYDCSGLPGGPAMPPAALLDRHAAVTAVVDDATGSTVSLDFCSPAADCIAMPGTLRIQARGFTLGGGPLALRPGQFLRIRSRVQWSFACSMQVEVSNAPTWDGAPNPVRTDASLLAAASSGEGHALPSAPFEVDRAHIGCAEPGPTCSSDPRELYALSFQGHCNTCLRDPDPVIVRQGGDGLIEAGGHRYTATNLESYSSGYCDDYWSWAWTVREAYLD